jgi:hypothetical protein
MENGKWYKGKAVIGFAIYHLPFAIACIVLISGLRPPSA